MDLNLMTAAHHIPENQLRFDEEAFDLAASRFEKRLSLVRLGWKRLEANVTAMTGYLHLVARLATSKPTQLG